MAANPYIVELRERLLLLLERHDPARAMFRVRNTSAPGDKSRFGLRAKSASGVKGDFHEIDLKAGETREGGYILDRETTFAEEDGEEDDDRETRIVQFFVARVAHEGNNETENAMFDAEVAAAFRSGGAKLRDPATPNTAIPYVYGWEEITYARAREMYKEVIRPVTRISIPLVLRMNMSDL